MTRQGIALTPKEIARRCAEMMYADDLASQRAGITVEDVVPGAATARMTVTESMINGHDVCHGGYVFLLADTAFAFACNSYNARTVAQSCEVTFLAPARLGDELVARATERLRRGRSGIYDVTVRRVAGGPGADDVVAEFRGHSHTVAGRLFEEDRP